MQVYPVLPPHEESGETAVGVTTGALEVALTPVEAVGAQAGALKAETLAGLEDGVRYQFASGSPKHSPMVTPLKPFLTMRSSM